MGLWWNSTPLLPRLLLLLGVLGPRMTNPRLIASCFATFVRIWNGEALDSCKVNNDFLRKYHFPTQLARDTVPSNGNVCVCLCWSRRKRRESASERARERVGGERREG